MTNNPESVWFMELPDQELMRRVAQGDHPSFALLYDRYAARVMGLLCRFVTDRAAAEDLLQVTFWQVWQKANQYDPSRSNFEVWLFLIARSRALDYLDRVKRAAKQQDIPERTMDIDPSKWMEQRESCQRVREALTRLPEDQSRAIRLTFFGGLTHQEIARHEGIPLGTVKTRIRLAMQRLKHLLEPISEVNLR